LEDKNDYLGLPKMNLEFTQAMEIQSEAAVARDFGRGYQRRRTNINASRNIFTENHSYMGKRITRLQFVILFHKFGNLIICGCSEVIPVATTSNSN
jgi:hypothetical protein